VYHEPGSVEVPGSCGSSGTGNEVRVRRGRLRALGAAIERACDRRAAERIILAPLPAGVELGPVLEGMLLRAYATLEFTPDEQSTSVESIKICCGDESPARTRAIVRETQILVESQNMARHLADLPANVGTPAEIVGRATASAKEVGLRAKTIDAARAKRLGMHLLTAVGQGSVHEPCVLILEHKPRTPRKVPTVVMIGKGVTHDTGGYNLKRGAGIAEMSYDKAGAAAVIGAVHAMARLKMPVHIVAIAPLVENAIGGKAYKPGDILKGPGDTSIYIENTDAEGRLVLADCLAFATRYAPDLVIDVATLTDAAHVALGDPYAALYSNDDRARDVLVEAGQVTGEPVWPMPIDDEHDAALRHNRAHLRNSAGRPGAAGIAAAFLRRFVDFPWAHVDMGGRGYAPSERTIVGPGATGFGTRLLVEATRRFVGGGNR
jgi:leucyl aminopeptidase